MFTIPRKPANTSTSALSKGLTAGEDALLSELQKISAALSSQPIADQELSSFKANTLLQFLGILAATVFGIFSILAWLAANKSNTISANALSQALQSNQLALLAYCLSGGSNTNAAAICANILSEASDEVAPIVGSDLPSVATSASATSTSASVFSSSPGSTSTTTENAASTTTTDLAFTTITSSSALLTSVASLATSSSSISTTSPVGSATIGGPSTTNASQATATVPVVGAAASPSNLGTANTAAIIGGVVGAVAAIAAVLLFFWRWRAYKEMVVRSHPRVQEKDSEAM